MTRAPIFELLDAMIAQGYGSVPQRLIPENWREIPREVHRQDLDRIRAEELTPEKERIRDIEDSNSGADPELAARVLAHQKRKRSLLLGRPRGIGIPKWQRIAWREAAMRARSANA